MGPLLAGHTALVTGGARGIGRAITQALAREGARVLVNYSSSEKEAVELVEELRRDGVEAHALKADVSVFEEAKQLVAEAKAIAPITILVNNAGTSKDRILARMTLEDWNRVVGTNLGGTFNVTRAAVFDMMKRRSGRIINISSVSGIAGMAGQSNYSASKAGIIGFTKAIARETGPFQVTANVVAPGLIDTDMLKTIPANILNQQIGFTPLARVGTPAEVADAVVFLASDRARYITGQVLCVDGGLAM